MPFQISELVIRVTADSPDGAMSVRRQSANAVRRAHVHPERHGLPERRVDVRPAERAL